MPPMRLTCAASQGWLPVASTPDPQQRYEDARAWLAFLINHPDTTVSVSAYRKQITAAMLTVGEAHTAMMEARA